MTDYIERTMANEALRECVRTYPNSFYNGIEVARSVIIKIPAADVRPVVKAEWLPFGKRGIYGMMYACSSCPAKYDGKTNFCPSCGADMRGTNDEKA